MCVYKMCFTYTCIYIKLQRILQIRSQHYLLLGRLPEIHLTSELWHLANNHFNYFCIYHNLSLSLSLSLSLVLSLSRSLSLSFFFSNHLLDTYIHIYEGHSINKVDIAIRYTVYKCTFSRKSVVMYLFMSQKTVSITFCTNSCARKFFFTGESLFPT